MKTVAIFGVGLIGGSFGLALRRAGFRGRILGVSSMATIQAARSRGAIDLGVAFEDAAKADLIYLAQPVAQILATLPDLARLVPPGTLVTDAGSTKREIVAKASTLFREGQFLGGHPMAGKAVRGVGAASADLFDGRPYLLTPSKPEHMESPAAKSLLEWIGKIGAHAVVVTPEQHDRVVAGSSHLPQLVSTALAAALARHPDSAALAAAAGPGLIDMTRIAMSDYALWGDILATNRDAVREALALFQSELAAVQRLLDDGGLEQEFHTAAAFAAAARKHSSVM